MNALGFVLPGWAKWAALAVLALALYAFGRIDGTRIEGAKHSDYVANQALQAVRIVQARAKVVTETEIKYRDRVQVIYKQGEQIVKTIPVYVTPDIDRRFPVPVGFVRVHRAATSGTAAGGASDLDGEASDVGLSAVAEVDAQNYTECRKWQAQVIGWQEYYEKIKAVR